MPRTPPKESGWVAYVAYKLRPEYRIMPEANRFQLAAFLVDILESPHDRVDVDVYCSVGFRQDTDFFVRYEAPTAEEIQEICVKINQSGLGRHLDTSHNWLGLYRPRPQAAEASSEEDPGEAAFHVIYPLAKNADWFALPEAERGAMMREHGSIARKYPAVWGQTISTFGLGDQDWLVAMDVAKLEEFEAMIREMRHGKAAAYHKVHQPVLVGRCVTAHEALELCGAL